MNRAPADPIAARCLLVKNLCVARPHALLFADTSRSDYTITGNDLYDLFGKFGSIRQVRLGNDAANKTKGTAIVVFDSPDDASTALNQLSGFNLGGRYLIGEQRQVFCGERH